MADTSREFAEDESEQARLEDGCEDENDEFEYDWGEEEMLADCDEEYEEGMSE